MKLCILFSSFYQKLTYIPIAYALILNVSWAQYMPLDLLEANQRVIYQQPENILQDSSGKMYGMDISIISNSGTSLFFVPSFRKKIRENITYNYKLFLTTDSNYGPRIGSRYERSGNYTGPSKPGDLSILQSYIYIDLKSTKIRLGKFSPWDNNNRISGIINENYLSPIHGFELQYSFLSLKYTHGNYWLGYSSTNDDVDGYSRFYATQKIEYSGKYLNIEMGDRVLYAGINQAFDWRYIVPLDPFILSVFNFGAPENKDNHAIDMSFAWYVNDNLRISGKLIIDEYQIDADDRKLDADEYGYQISVILNTGRPYMRRIAINHTRTTDYFGIHYGKSVNYEINGIPILSEYGPQVRRTELIQNYYFKQDRLRGWVSLFRESRGENRILGTPWEIKSEQSEYENWTHRVGFETEILINLYKNYYSYLLFSLDDINGPIWNLSILYSFNWSQ